MELHLDHINKTRSLIENRSKDCEKKISAIPSELASSVDATELLELAVFYSWVDIIYPQAVWYLFFDPLSIVCSLRFPHKSSLNLPEKFFLHLFSSSSSYLAQRNSLSLQDFPSDFVQNILQISFYMVHMNWVRYWIYWGSRDLIQSCNWVVSQKSWPAWSKTFVVVCRSMNASSSTVSPRGLILIVVAAQARASGSIKQSEWLILLRMMLKVALWPQDPHSGDENTEVFISALVEARQLAPTPLGSFKFEQHRI